MNRLTPRLTALAGATGLALVAWLNLSPGLTEAHATAATPVAAMPATRQTLPDFADLVSRVGPAVVNISVVQQVASPLANSDDPFYDFLRRFGVPVPGMPGGPNIPGIPGQGQGGRQIARGVGSGFIVSADGYVLTNAHVVDDATEVTVRLTDKREFKAKVEGVDKRTDVALLKIDAKDLPTVRIGDPEATRVGEWVVAVGSPFGFDNTVTAGIISAKARRLPDETYVPFIQTDVAINPGNSGGPLFNLDGEVVGINSQIYSRSGGFMGISFAIPIDVAMKVKDQLQTFGVVRRGRLGVIIQGLDKELADSFGLDDPKGALVSSVEPGSAAAKAKLQPGDVILGVNGDRVADSADLPRIIGEMPPGTTIRLEIWRDRKARSIEATLGGQDNERLQARGGGQQNAGGKLGLSARPLSAAEAEQLKVPGGLVVEDVDGPAARAGIQKGDVVLALNNTPVKDVAGFRKLLEQAGDRFALLVQRGEGRLYLGVRLK
ncbi:DegQ family serine endoprotease [Denitromonas ohlonensis]|uniref:Probable periplasmic serine endoprotease DegP-like n=2 Tax=Denitromonas TaxID=139331 RepID=A0A557RQH1_9RHOO|nr:DegQ family serine endoprotease [Denitromonas ohlonensis]TVO67393.1 DegQ family serine endoprotease [Denitromonas ohlonensis]TVO72012.1 DegQ family serine endoprotease [Denitromonas ohlonensis]